LTILADHRLVKTIRPVDAESLVGDKITPENPLFGLVWINPGRVSGEPCFYATRVPISSLFDTLAAGETLEQFLEDFEGVTREQAEAALQLAKSHLLDDLLRA
jgi:uncharacterized protein (DUF433 family)